MQNLYPDRQVDVELSDGNDNVLKEPTGDDANDGGATSAEHIAPNPISSNVVGPAHPSVADQVDATAPLVGGQNRKRPPHALKCKQSKTPADQVITQIELPPYHRPQSPLDLVAAEIIFGRLFEAFRHASQAVGAGTSAGGAAPPTKKICGPPMKSMLAPR
jgi:hypothetical protein